MDPSAASHYLNEVIAGRYRLDRLIGSGTFAWVFRAHVVGDERRQVACKVLHSTEPTARIRFAREMQVLRALPPHPAVVGLIDAGHTADGWPVMVLEYVDGITLKAGIDRCPRLSPEKALAFVGELCEAFVELHRLGVAHRDVKPENILLARAGGIKLIDFGLIRDAQGLLKLLEEEDPLERRVFADELDLNFLVGTPEYMAPEQFSDAAVADAAEVKTDTWSDVFSLGVILYQLLAGRKPFPMRAVPADQYPREMLRYMQWRISLRDDELEPCPGIDRALDSVLRKALRQDPRQRQPNASALLNDIRRYQQTGLGVIVADESRTHVVNVADLMSSLGSSPLSALAPAPSGSHRELPSIAEEAEPDELMGSVEIEISDAFEEEVSARSLPLIDDDSGPESHTVIFFGESEDALEDLDPELEVPTRRPSAPRPTGASYPARQSGVVSSAPADPWPSADPAAPGPLAGSSAPADPWPSASPAAPGPLAGSSAPADPWPSASPAAPGPVAGSSVPADPWGSPATSPAPSEIVGAGALEPSPPAAPWVPTDLDPEDQTVQRARTWRRDERPDLFAQEAAPPDDPWANQPAPAPSGLPPRPLSSPGFDPRLESPLPPEPRTGPSTDALVRASQLHAFDSGDWTVTNPWVEQSTTFEETTEQWGGGDGAAALDGGWPSADPAASAPSSPPVFAEEDDDATFHDADADRRDIVAEVRELPEEPTRRVDVRRLVPGEFSDPEEP